MTLASSLAQLDVAVIGITHLSDRGLTNLPNPSNLAGG
jgi:hypothetical protein